MRHLITFPDGEQKFVWLPDNQTPEEYLATLSIDTTVVSDTEDSNEPQVMDLNPKNEHLEEQISAGLEAGNINLPEQVFAEDLSADLTEEN